MSLPVRSLPVIQNWDCHGCSDCCRTYHVPVTADEKKVIDSQGWDADPELAGVQTLVVDQKTGEFRLAQRPDETCVFLGADNRCRIHAKFGSAGKPLACRLYPFVAVPAGDHWRVGMRFACPSVIRNDGRPLSAHTNELKEYTRLLEGKAPAGQLPPPPLDLVHSVEWPDLLRFTKAAGELLSTPDRPIERCLRGLLAVSAECRQARFDKVRGKRLDEFLALVSAVVEDVPADPYSVPPPSWVGRMMFRQYIAIYARKDVGLNRGRMAELGMFGRALAAWRFSRGTGRIPPVHAVIGNVTFETAEQPAGPLPPECEELLSRYYRVKVESMQFCGATNHHLGFWDGLDSLVVTYPAVMWLSRVIAAGGRPREEAIPLALRIVDDNFGYNPLLGHARQARAIRMMNQKLELPKLVAWYSR